MKVLYASFRHNPLDPDAASGTDYNYHRALVREGCEVRIVGPLKARPWLLERFLKRMAVYIGRRSAKFSVRQALQFGSLLTKADFGWHPDVIFSIFPVGLSFYRGATPCVYRTDFTFRLWQAKYPEFGKLGLYIGIWQEQLALKTSALVVTPSERTLASLVEEYAYPSHRIRVLANPAALPEHVIPRELNLALKPRPPPVRLLLVGRDYNRKGVDIGLAVARLMNESGVHTELTVCGVRGESHQNVRFVGPFLKCDSQQLDKYCECYRNAHLLLHPARFEHAGIVPSEAAAFGVPTITNDTGGLRTVVADGISGVVLPEGSPAAAYVDVISKLISNRQQYISLCLGARERFEKLLNWKVAGKRLAGFLEDAVGH